MHKTNCFSKNQKTANIYSLIIYILNAWRGKNLGLNIPVKLGQ